MALRLDKAESVAKTVGPSVNPVTTTFAALVNLEARRTSCAFNAFVKTAEPGAKPDNFMVLLLAGIPVGVGVAVGGGFSIGVGVGARVSGTLAEWSGVEGAGDTGGGGGGETGVGEGIALKVTEILWSALTGANV